MTLVVLVAALAFTARQPSPPQIAELTPQAQHQITKSPSQPGSSVGSAMGGGGGSSGPGSGLGPHAAASTTLAAAPSVPTNTAAVHHCFGNPPRQIQDTQSPPCVAYWAGNNGGATATGVTGDQITVTVDPLGNGLDQDPTGTQDQRVMQDLQEFFNRYFEFYGRTLHLINATVGGGVDCSTAQAQADGGAALRPFASTDISDNAEVCRDAELARKGVVVATFGQVLSQSTMSSFRPYLWEYPMSPDMVFASTGAFTCAQLAGHDAAYSPDPTIATKPRKFGVILEYWYTPYPYSLAPLDDQLARCGVTNPVTRVFEETASTQEDAGTFSQQAVLAMRQAGVTTVLCFCSYVNLMETYLAPAANSQSYHPEWVLASWGNGQNGNGRTDWSEEQQGLIGLTVHPDQVPYSDSTLNWALQAVDPGFEVRTNAGPFQQFYWEMLLLASGIQMAGPDLTPQTFASGLQAAHFPNPFSPEQEGIATFLGGSYSMTADEAVMWWSPSAVGPNDNAGAWCYVDGGRRFNPFDWPRTPLSFFAGTCDSSPPGT